MGFFIRKAFRFGPFRLNLSKSGVGASVGVKGLRVSTGPRGTELYAGRGGVYYREKLGAGHPHEAHPHSIAPAPASRPHTALWVVLAFLAGGGIAAVLMWLR